jgi:Zn-dependent protease with chaperone function
MNLVSRLRMFGILFLVLFLVPTIAFWLAGKTGGDVELMVRAASVAVSMCGLMLFALIFGSKMFAGTDRVRMARVFSPAIRLAMVILSVSVAAQAILLLISFFFIASHLHLEIVGRIGLLLLAISGGALFAAYQVVTYAFSAMKSPAIQLRGIVLDTEQHQPLYAMVRALADKLGAEPPDQIVAGLEPSFFVTTGAVKIPRALMSPLQATDALGGRTLYVSLGLMRLFTKSEFAAVVGHELGHFRGKDLDYSVKFAPTYARLTQSLRDIEPGEGSYSALGCLPAYVTLVVALSEFASAERAVGRERELLADQAGVQASDTQSFARALVKVSLFGIAWQRAMQEALKERQDTATTPNLALLYVKACGELVPMIDWEKARAFLMADVQAHPIDTHPPLGQRLKAIGITLDQVLAEKLDASNDSSVGLLNDTSAMEETLTVTELDTAQSQIAFARARQMAASFRY